MRFNISGSDFLYLACFQIPQLFVYHVPSLVVFQLFVLQFHIINKGLLLFCLRVPPVFYLKFLEGEKLRLSVLCV